jgi:hypothetical protein
MAEEHSAGEAHDDAQRAASDDMADVIDVTDADVGRGDQVEQVEQTDSDHVAETGSSGSTGRAGPVDRDTRTLRSIDVRTAAKFGALLSGVVALMQSSVALMVYGVTLGRAGLVDTWAKGMLYAGRSLFGLLLMAVVAAAIGGGLWALAAYLYNLLARATGGLRFTWD